MSKLRFEISVSLNGYVTAPGVSLEDPMGPGGQLLHEWAFGDDDRSNQVLGDSQGSSGASIAGRRTYDVSISSWGADGPGKAELIETPRSPIALASALATASCSSLNRPSRSTPAALRDRSLRRAQQQQYLL